ncbi:histamine H2 receptor-like [Onychostruthus taczanowskii]|uniref:histamine H2 receptor-like n=1 Tax=Onychostruthus taczanowskii TaxID=356909 RepID=UPI001B7FFA8C|nr:histamine H2 receptor-like [Onychostruthus taczanowskii]
MVRDDLETLSKYQLPAALDQYKSIYRKDFCWHDDYHSPIQAHVPTPSYLPLEDLPRCYLPECQPSDLTPRWAGKLEILAEPMHDLSCCSPLPAPALTDETEEVLEPRAPPPVITYQQFAQDLYKEVLSNADKYKTKNRSSYIRFNESRWVTEYGDSYSIFLKRLDWSSPISAQWLPFGKDVRWTPRWKLADFNSGKMLTDRNESWLSNFSSAASSFARGGVGLQEVLVGLVLTLIDVVTLLGNTVVFLCPVVEKRLRTVTYMFIMSLATADFLVACLVMPFSIIYEVTGMWLFGKLFCKVWISFDVMFCTASIVTLCFISLDRYCSVVTPYHYSRRMSRGRCIVMTCTVWVYSSLISFLPVMQGWNEIPGVDFDAGRECIFVTNWVFAIVASALAFFLPFMVMCSMYFFIYRASRLKATRIMSQTLEIHYHPNSKRQNHLQLENKATRTISIIISVFVLCWLPYFVLNVWLAARGTDSTSTVLLGTFKIITWLGYCNSTINPLLYAFLNRDFQHALRKLLLCRRRSQVDAGEDMVSIATFSKTAPDLEYSVTVPNGAPKGKPKS